MLFIDQQNLENATMVVSSTHFITSSIKWIYVPRQRLGNIYINTNVLIFIGYCFYNLGFEKRLLSFYFQVIIDLHGAPGSQNGRDHSGRRGNHYHAIYINIKYSSIK